MANVTVTRTDGSTETIVLTDKKEDGQEYMTFKCSDGVTRYALLGESTDSKASHLWIEKDGVKKYCLKDSTTALTFSDIMQTTDANGVVMRFWTTNVNNLFSFVPTYTTIEGLSPVMGVNIYRGASLSAGAHEIELTIQPLRYIETDGATNDISNIVKSITVKGTIPADSSTPLTIVFTTQQQKDFLSAFDVKDEFTIQGTYTYTLS